MEIARFNIDYNKYCFLIYKTKNLCDLCLENKAYFIYKKNNSIYYVCKFCLKAKVIELFNDLIKGYFNSIRILTNRHYIIVKRIKHNSNCAFCECENNVEFEIIKYKINHNYICSECLRQELTKLKNYLMILISVKK